ncbi:MAG: hypothetical protein AAF355_03555 [Myxococcota bacterium]
MHRIAQTRCAVAFAVFFFVFGEVRSSLAQEGSAELDDPLGQSSDEPTSAASPLSADAPIEVPAPPASYRPSASSESSAYRSMVPSDALPETVQSGPDPQTVRPASGVHEHDGVMLRIMLGGGYATGDFSTPDLNMRGGVAFTDIAIGGSVAPNLTLHGNLLAVTAPGPRADGSALPLGSDEEVYVSAGGLGIGVTYWMMPKNIFVSGSLGLASARVEATSFTYDTDIGLALLASSGKEWWVSDSWALGLAVSYTYLGIPSADGYSFHSFGLGLSVTYQ